MTLICNVCGNTVADEYVDPKTQLALCPNCQTVLVASTSEKSKTTIKAPDRMTLTQDAEGPELIYSWPRDRVLVETIVSGSLGVGFILLIGFQELIGANTQFRIALIVFVPFLILGIYNFFMTAFNRAHIRITASQVTVRQKPLWAIGNRNVPRNQIEQVNVVFLKDGFGRTRRAPAQYHVWALLKNRTRVALVSNLPNELEALYIKQELSRMLDLQDPPVVGKYAQPLG